MFGDWFNVACGVRQRSVEGPVLANIYIDCMMRDVLRRHPNAGIWVHYRVDGRWMDPEDMIHETRISCLLYADDCVLFASSE